MTVAVLFRNWSSAFVYCPILVPEQFLLNPQHAWQTFPPYPFALLKVIVGISLFCANVCDALTSWPVVEGNGFSTVATLKKASWKAILVLNLFPLPPSGCDIVRPR